MLDFVIPLSKNRDIYFVQGKNKGKIPYTNALLIKEYLIDTGISPLYLKKLKKKFRIQHIIFSHWHDDHIRDNKILQECEHLSHEKAKPIIEDIDKLKDLYDIRDTPVEIAFDDFLSNIIDVYGMHIERTFTDNQIFNMGKNLEFRVIYTPGHSIGHCCFYEPNLKLAFLSDIELSKFGPWYGGLDSSIVEFKTSIDKILELEIQTAVTGHSGIIKGEKIIKKKLREYRRIFGYRDEKIVALLSNTKPLSVDDLTGKNIIYSNYEFFKPFLIRMERTMIQKHLDNLVKENRIIKQYSGYLLP
ncbi:MAG: Hydroxyacylglutathione hydrolase [Promethearchaeota archaeon]|nr:MAG: Hydroxyacylglutathione hydrolase [Candidatus Lokiarchaeota archaeon]